MKQRTIWANTGNSCRSHFEIRSTERRLLVAIDEEIVPELTRIARSKMVRSERLINAWLKEEMQASKAQR